MRPQVIDFPAWVLALVIFTLLVVVVLTFRSLRKWRQPPPGRDSDAQSADDFLTSTTKNSGYNSF